MKDVPPSEKRVLAIIDMMEDAGLYTHGQEVARLDRYRVRLEQALTQIVSLVNSTKVHPAVRHIALNVTTIANQAMGTGKDPELEYIEKIALELREAGKTSRADIEDRLRQDGKL